MSSSRQKATVKTVQTSILEIAYEESGSPLHSNDNPPIILLHGWPYSIRQYDTLVSKLLQKYHDQHTILVPHLRGFGQTRYLDSSSEAAKQHQSGQQAAIAQDLLDFLNALSIPVALLVGYDWGGRAACIIAALHPNRVHSLITCQGYAIQNIAFSSSTPPSSAQAASALWYQFYFNMPIGVRCLEDPKTRNDLAKYLWTQWSPNWNFTDAEFNEAAKAFENEDFAATTVHSYRHRWGTVPGIESLEHIESELAKEPQISVPAINVRGGSDTVTPGPGLDEEDSERKHFSGFYKRVYLDAVGHCPPVEDPEAVLAAVEELLGFGGEVRG